MKGQDFIEEYNRYLKGFSQSVLESVNSPLYNFAEMHKKHVELLSDRAKIALSTLGYYGWYIPSLDHCVSYPSQLANELNNNNEKYVDYEMMSFLNKNFKKLSRNIIDNNPKRTHILEQVFKAHKSKKYALSVPVFLSQADGICKEITNHGLFFKNNKLPETKGYVDSIDKNPLLLSYLEPLRILLPIIYSDKYLDDNMKFNRHKILHGEDYSYDNEITSLKAFSLLSYINTFLHYE